MLHNKLQFLLGATCDDLPLTRRERLGITYRVLVKEIHPRYGKQDIMEI